jgi:hypothetical protein
MGAISMDIRTALLSDLEGIVRLLADDELGVSRERFELLFQDLLD